MYEILAGLLILGLIYGIVIDHFPDASVVLSAAAIAAAILGLVWLAAMFHIALAIILCCVICLFALMVFDL
jgi:hypothetical protein